MKKPIIEILIGVLIDTPSVFYKGVSIPTNELLEELQKEYPLAAKQVEMERENTPMDKDALSKIQYAILQCNEKILSKEKKLEINSKLHNLFTKEGII